MRNKFLAVMLVVFSPVFAMGEGGGVVGTKTGTSRPGTSNTIPKYLSNGQIGNSGVTDDGTTVTTSEAVTVNGTLTSGSSFRLNPLNASTTGQITNGAASATADLQQWQVNSSTVAKITANGGLVVRTRTKSQVDSLTPVEKGEEIWVVDYGAFGAYANANNDFIKCYATGTAVAQWAVENSTRGVNMSGCGTGK